jgi:hypothetical protein
MNRRRAFFLALLTVSLAGFGACDNEPVSKPTPAGYIPTYPADYYADASDDAATGDDSGEGDAGEDAAGEDANGSQGDDAAGDSASPSSDGSDDGGGDAAG